MTSRLMEALCRFGAAGTASNATVKFDPRPRIMNLACSACSPRSMRRLRACWAVHCPVGCKVTPRMRMRRVACSITAPGRADAAGLEDLPNGRCCDVEAQASHLAVDPPVSPVGVLASQPTNQGLDVPRSCRPAGLAVRGPGGPAAAGDVAVPAHDRVRGHQQPQAPAPRFRYYAEQGSEQGPVGPVQLRPPRAADAAAR